MRLAIDAGRLRQYSEQKGWTDAELARRWGVGRATVCRILNGDRGAGSAAIGRFLVQFPDAEGIVILTSEPPPVQSPKGNGCSHE